MAIRKRERTTLVALAILAVGAAVGTLLFEREILAAGMAMLRLRSADSAVRKNAAKRLGELQVAFATSAIAAALREERNDETRDALADALGSIGPAAGAEGIEAIVATVGRYPLGAFL